MMLGSSAREDKCRECGGDGSSCNTVQGLLEMDDLQVGENQTAIDRVTVNLLIIPFLLYNIKLRGPFNGTPVGPASLCLNFESVRIHLTLNLKMIF